MTNNSDAGAAGTILIVEDDRIIVRALKRLFEWNNYRVEVCVNGLLALPSYRDVMPHAILLDLHLPGASGIDVCRLIRSESKQVPIIILSGVADITNKVVLLELGADDYVTKPFSPKELLARVRAAIRRSSSQLPPGWAIPNGGVDSLTWRKRKPSTLRSSSLPKKIES